MQRGNQMIKKDFIQLYSEINGVTDIKEVSQDVDEFLDTMREALKKHPKVVFWNFGIFEVRETAKRKIVDPRGNNNIINSKPRKYVKFRVSKNIENMLYDKEK